MIPVQVCFKAYTAVVQLKTHHGDIMMYIRSYGYNDQ